MYYNQTIVPLRFAEVSPRSVENPAAKGDVPGNRYLRAPELTRVHLHADVINGKYHVNYHHILTSGFTSKFSPVVNKDLILILNASRRPRYRNVDSGSAFTYTKLLLQQLS